MRYIQQFKNSFLLDILEICNIINVHEEPNTQEEILARHLANLSANDATPKMNYNLNRVHTNATAPTAIYTKQNEECSDGDGDLESGTCNNKMVTHVEPENDNDDDVISQNKSDACQSFVQEVDSKNSIINENKESLSSTYSMKDPFLVTWHGPDDPDNPMNWSFAMKFFMTFQIMTLTCVTYMGSTIHTPGQEQIQEEFHVGHVVGTLNLSVYVLGYGVGPMFFSPLSEFARLGRQQIYILTFMIFGLFQVGCALVDNIYGLIILRFFSGVVSSPALTTGGATLADYINEEKLTYFLGLWAIAAFAAPIIGPIVGAAMVDAVDWRWQFWLLLFVTGACLLVLAPFFPETQAENILFRRALRLRKITGDKRYYTIESEEEKKLTTKEFLINSLYKPFRIIFYEPIAVAFDLYLAVCYALFYLFFEAFPIVFVGLYDFTLVELGLAYLGFIVTDIFAYLVLIYFTIKVINPTFQNGTFTPEVFLILPMCVSWLLPVALFFFGWTAGVHWMLPIVSEFFFDVCVFNLFQSTYAYLASCYPRYVASVFAGNGFCHAALAAGFPLFGKAMFNNLGSEKYPVGWGCSLLGFITLGLATIPFVIYKYGPYLRSKSKFSG
ncbi:hypothetical protein TBLA_0C07220 [Henningerozyma blattae CBS 6284]|uniref:Major facilitator superfamily (MFS) profile domain-containing protein n=1 Tax=Henningerozyma blattae (strain ATCC 34711 / CBS 6284 / DSM 70876 / NBRC 10599 / NRRL Y-10934 / UCD 77-7) TaxID=1071380 RepID=I2H2B1_HENB6|nr:hypothetical protein TBLA_0C07220 [Tetrapisispora blattae CBS 6284]CCH60513.1 hypothetical protein TBLA_0C07220 [Tetrapisispora blattae CBS 6284]